MNEKNANIELCLCKGCADAFYHSAAYRITRIDPLQVIKEECSYCQLRRGYDYRIKRRSGYKTVNVQH